MQCQPIEVADRGLQLERNWFVTHLLSFMLPISQFTTSVLLYFYQAVILRWLAGGSCHDICGLFGLGPGSFFSEKGPLWPTLYAIHEALSSEIVFDASRRKVVATQQMDFCWPVEVKLTAAFVQLMALLLKHESPLQKS
jgi:hypothetical protein